MASSPRANVSILLNAAASFNELEALVSAQEAAVTESLDLLESTGKAAAKEQSKHMITGSAAKANLQLEPTSTGKLFKGIGTNIAQDWLKSKGGFLKFSAWMWQGMELGATVGSLIGGTIAWPIALIECGSFALDVWEEQIKIAHAEAVSDLSKKFDRVVHIHTEVARRLRSNGQALFKSCESIPTRVTPYWTKGDGDKALKLLGSGAGHPSGRQTLLGLTRKAMMKHLLEIDNARFEVYLLGTQCEALVKHGMNVNSDPSNAVTGFPDYTGYVSPERGKMIQNETATLNPVVRQCAGLESRLSNTGFNLWSLVGHRIGISQSQASPSGF